MDTQPDNSITWPALKYHLSVLQEQIRPLRADREFIGSDIRFPFFALQAGYQLWGDPEARAAHLLDYPLTPDDYEAQPDEISAKQAAEHRKYVMSERKRLEAQLVAVRNA